MADKDQDAQGAESQQEAQGDEAKNQGVDRLSDLERKLEEQNKAINSLNSVNDKLTRELEDREKKAEAEKQEKMTDIEKMQQQLEQERSERQRWQREVAIEKNTATAKDFLHSKSLPAGFVEFLDTSDSEAMNAGLEKLSQLVEDVRGSVAEELKTKRGSPAPSVPDGETKRSKGQMSIGERMAFIKEHGKDAFEALPA